MNDFQIGRENAARRDRATQYHVRSTADENMFVVEPFVPGTARTHIVTLRDSDFFPSDPLDPALNPAGCTCEDYRFKKSEHKGWCKHRLAVAQAEGTSSMVLVALMNPVMPVLSVQGLEPDGRPASAIMSNLNLSFDNEIGRVVIAADATSVEITLFPKGEVHGIPLLIADTKNGLRELGMALGAILG